MKKALFVSLFLLVLLFTCGVTASAETDVRDVSSYEEMVAYVRNAMIDRADVIRFRYTGSDYRAPEIDDLCADTDNGAAGDYLRLSFNGSFPVVQEEEGGIYTLTPSYYSDAGQEAQVAAFVSSFAEGCSLTDTEEKAKYVYDWLCDNVQFDLENLYDDAVLTKYTAYGAAIEGKAVCQGFAQLCYRLSKAIGVDCRIVTGTRAGEPHAWNIIRSGDYWYHVDASSGAQLLDPSAYYAQPRFSNYTIVYGLTTANEIKSYRFPNTASPSSLAGALSDTVSFVLDKESCELTVFGTGEVPRSPLFSSSYYYGNSYYQWCSLSHCVRMIRIMDGITGIVPAAFSGCEDVETILLPDSLTSIGIYAFACPKLQAISIPAGVEQMQATSFHYRSTCSTITVSPENTTYHAEGNCVIATAEKKLVMGCPASVIPSDGSVTSIGDKAFCSHSAPTSITVPGTVLSIGEEAFKQSDLSQVTFEEGVIQMKFQAFSETALETLVLPDSATMFEGFVFESCQNLTSVILPKRLSEIRAGMFASCRSLTDISIPDSVWRIQREAFFGCSGMTAVDLNRVSVIEGSAFWTCPVQAFSVPETNQALSTDENGVVFNKDKTELILYPCGKRDTSYEIPDTVTSIAAKAFISCNYLKEITVPDSVTVFGAGVFFLCKNLTSVRIPDGVTEIPSGLFEGCKALESMVIPDGVTKIGSAAFDSCSSLQTVTVPQSVTSVDEGILSSYPPFLSCPRLTIYGYAGSFIEGYAANKKIPFIPLCAVTGEPHATVQYEATAANCTDPAYTAGEYCPDCGAWIVPRQAVGEPLGHDPAAPEREDIVLPTCTKEGSYNSVIRCSRCSAILSSIPEKLAMTPHTDENRNGYCDTCDAYICTHSEVTLKNAKAATCTENGYSGDTVCEICGVTLTYGETRYAAGHTPVLSQEAVPATCISEGLTAAYACSVCGVPTTPAVVVPVTGHTDPDGDGVCNVCLAPLTADAYGAAGNGVYWYIEKETLFLTGSGAAQITGNLPWQAAGNAFDYVYVKEGVTALTGVTFPAEDRVFIPAACITDLPGAVSYTWSGSVATLSAADAPAFDAYGLLDVSYVFAADRTLSALRFPSLRLIAADGAAETEYDILSGGKLIDEAHFRAPSGTLLHDFSVSPTSYPSFNAVYAALGDHPDRNLILKIVCTDLLPEGLRQNAADYTVQLAIRFVDDPASPSDPAKTNEGNWFDHLIERFHATLAAMLALFKKIVKLFKNLF